MLKVYHIKTKIDNEDWSKFVFGHPKGNIFQSPEIYDVYSNTPKYKPLFLAVVDDLGSLVGILLAVIHKEHNGFLGKFSTRSIIMGGPLVTNDNEEVTNILLNEYLGLIKNGAVYTQVRNTFDQKNLHNIFENCGFQYQPHLDIIIQLEKSEEELWKNLDSRARNKIRKAEKNGVSVEVSMGKSDLKTFYIILKDVYQRAGLPLAHYSLFDKAFDILSSRNMLVAFYAKLGSKIIGGRLCLVYKDCVYDWYAGSDYEYYKFNPNDLLPWAIIKWGKYNGFKTYDFGGAGKPSIPYGVRDFKLKYGGELVEFGRYEKTHKPLLMSIGRLGIRYYKYLKP